MINANPDFLGKTLFLNFLYLSRCCPDLGGRLAQAGQLGKESTREQAKAQLNTLTDEEKALMIRLNDQYRQKFGFPFVLCARLNNKESIINGLKTRIKNKADEELETAMDQFFKICELRLRDVLVVSKQSKL